MPQAILTRHQDITEQKIADLPQAPLAPGQARFRVKRFALTANNVTYAATGFDIGYWRFYPAPEEGWGIVPVWGFATVTESRAEGLEPGQRFYGFWPMAEEAVLTPQPGRATLRDTSPHRADLPAVYNSYTPAPEAESDDIRALLQPLVATSWLIADWLADNACFGAEQVIVGSASSKTGLGLTAFLRDAPVRVIGLTSPANAAFVEALGYCDTVLPYEAVDTLEQVPSVYVDMAGNAEVKRALHARLGDLLKHSAAVGLSHWDKFAPPRGLAGPKPQFFFAPAQIAKRREEWGPGVVEARIAEATEAVARDAARWLTVTRHHGLDAARAPWAALATGRADPREGHVVLP